MATRRCAFGAAGAVLRRLERTRREREGTRGGRLGVDFGSISLCHVAADFTDATMEIANGFAVWDLSPGHYILHAAGGVTIDLDGNPIDLDYGLNTLAEINTTMSKRRKFIAAGNQALAEEIRSTIQI